ncbi:hypothetical protein ZIOFF_030751 [Zingiber officinale]|uniref:DDE Tnp4 domain-containing protein n=1 Tax=Zingiber officinale TaxID=94328 RepID=A0A8J5GYL2_ZINOF|nr:hypothetical protein ZIOFF_030751 [Zingiber officinale]
MKHSRARNVIERCFGLLKGHWKIIASPSFFPMQIQVRIIIACCLLHNLIHKFMSHDPQECIPDEDEQSEDDDSDRGTETEYIRTIAPTGQWTAFRNNLAQQMQSGCTWNDVEKKIVCEETWYLEWIKNHNDAKSLYNVPFPYFSELEMVYGKGRATSLVAEDPMIATQTITDVDAGLTISDDNSLAEKVVELDSMPNQQPSCSVEGFMQTASSHFESMSSWVQGKSSKMPQVLEMLDKYGFISKNKYKVAQVIFEDPVKVELLFSLDPSEVEDFILSCLK